MSVEPLDSETRQGQVLIQKTSAYQGVHHVESRPPWSETCADHPCAS